jgi:hypothetical protein
MFLFERNIHAHALVYIISTLMFVTLRSEACTRVTEFYHKVKRHCTALHCTALAKFPFLNFKEKI